MVLADPPQVVMQRPAVDPVKCRLCGECWRVCPAKAITPYARMIGFDYDRCIRCYCCLEVCPEAAIKKERGRLQWVFGS